MGKQRKYTPEFKIKCVKELMNHECGLEEMARRENINNHVISKWRNNFIKHGESYFYEEHRGKKSGNPYAALYTSKSLSKEERLELENLKLRIENERLKKGYMVKGVGANKEFVTTKDVNMK